MALLTWANLVCALISLGLFGVAWLVLKYDPMNLYEDIDG